MKTLKTRHQFYLPDELSAKLDQLASKPGNSKSSILTEALASWFERKAVNELDDRFSPRMDRQLRVLNRVESTLNVAAEMLDLYVQHQMTLLAYQPPFDEESNSLGKRRYRLFMDQVARRLGANQGLARITLSHDGQERKP
ncbi:CopG family transcriptional regulator [Sandaracinobacteroides hominis]|uniref:CopG family transcriptional regulator n=1 Tax=Sandaracinobacteroides hominis TaxID=2780086 RepID=UPI0018F688D3|nr:CopG family transcriptional regulator [Sandaracinobacteroides hominis]